MLYNSTLYDNENDLYYRIECQGTTWTVREETPEGVRDVDVMRATYHREGEAIIIYLKEDRRLLYIPHGTDPGRRTSGLVQTRQPRITTWLTAQEFHTQAAIADNAWNDRLRYDNWYGALHEETPRPPKDPDEVIEGGDQPTYYGPDWFEEYPDDGRPLTVCGIALNQQQYV